MGSHNGANITHICAPRVMYTRLGSGPPACEEKLRKKGRYRTKLAIPSATAISTKSAMRWRKRKDEEERKDEG